MLLKPTRFSFCSFVLFRISEGITYLWVAPPYFLESESQKIKMETATGLGKMCHQTTLANTVTVVDFEEGFLEKFYTFQKPSHLIFVPICH